MSQARLAAYVAAFSFSISAFAQSAEAPTATATEALRVVNGPRMGGYEKELRKIYPDASKVEEYSFLPREWGGISLMGLIGRLVGDRAHREFESINTRRYIYRAYQGKNVIGVAHGSTTDAPQSQMDVFVFYNPDTSIRDVRVDRVPGTILSRLEEGGYLKQFLNRPAEDFTVQIGRRGRITDWGAFVRQARRPADKETSGYFNSIMRTVRFNAAFVEVGYFIGQHPYGGSEGANASVQ
jgi:hypothetical protein